jgi:hypothetical protein
MSIPVVVLSFRRNESLGRMEFIGVPIGMQGLHRALGMLA